MYNYSLSPRDIHRNKSTSSLTKNLLSSVIGRATRGNHPQAWIWWLTCRIFQRRQIQNWSQWSSTTASNRKRWTRSRIKYKGIRCSRSCDGGSYASVFCLGSTRWRGGAWKALLRCNTRSRGTWNHTPTWYIPSVRLGSSKFLILQKLSLFVNYTNQFIERLPMINTTNYNYFGILLSLYLSWSRSKFL